MKVFLLGFAILVFTAISAYGQTHPVDTDGNGYYNISILDELRWISENENARSWDFEMDNDIDISGFPVGVYFVVDDTYQISGKFLKR